MTNEIIEKIRAVQDELVRLGVKKQYIPFAKLDDDGLNAELEAVTEQLERRKKFLGES